MFDRQGIDNLIGQSLKGYRITRFLARGGMGVVFEGVQESLDRPVAIKILYPHLSEDGQFRERFEREARAAARLIHPNIVRVLDFGAENSLYFMVQDLVDGESLRDRLARVYAEGLTLRTETTISIVRQVADALSYAHNLGYVHRDVKPGNVLLTRDGRALLTDFGVVKILGEAQVTSQGLIIGTPEYMAPEQSSGEGAIGQAADQYSLAVVAYELLVGRVPFQAPTPVAVMRMHLTDPPPAPRSIVPWFPAEIEAVLMRALAKKPEDRYESVDAFVGALLAATSAAPPFGAPGAAQTPVPGAQSSTPMPSGTPAATGAGATPEPVGATPVPVGGEVATSRTSRRLMIGGGILALAIIVAMAGFLLRDDLLQAARGGGESPDSAGAVTQTTTPTAPTPTTPGSQPTETPASTEPAGGYGSTPTTEAAGSSDMIPVIVFSSNRGGVHESQIFVMNPDGSGQRQLTFSRGHSWAPRISPDGTKLMFSTVIGHHETHDPSGGALAGESNNHDIYVADISGTGPETIQVTNLRNLTADSLGWDNGWSWSPDSQQIAFSSDRDGNFEIYVMSADGRDVQRLTDDPANDGWPVWTPDGRSIIFSSDRDGNEDIYIMDTSGKNVRRLVDRPDTFDAFPAISPDGQKVIFSSQLPGVDQGEIYIMNIDGSDVRPLTSAAALDNIPTWCSDGARIVFMSDRDGNPNGNIYSMDADGGNLKRLTFTDTLENQYAGDQVPQCGYVRKTQP